MYIPAPFAETRPDASHRLIHDHPFGTLVTHGAEGLDADHLPFEFDAAAGPLGTLTAHVARANSLWTRCPTGTPVMVIFHGAAGYVSPNWYPSKHVAHRQVPTWNYEVVHVHGTLVVRDDERFVRGLVARLTRRHESGEAKPWRMADSAPDFIDGLLGQIVGLEIVATSIVAKRKLGQNKDARDRDGAADGLDATGNPDLARAMRQAPGF